MIQEDLVKEIFDSFFVIFTVSIMGLVIYLHLFGLQDARLRDIIAIFIISVLTALVGVVFYSKKEPKRGELIVRYLLHSVLIFGIIFVMATYMGWIYWGEISTVVRFAALIIGIFVFVHAIVFYQTKRLADKLNEKLHERYKK